MENESELSPCEKVVQGRAGVEVCMSLPVVVTLGAGSIAPTGAGELLEGEQNAKTRQ